MQIVNKKMLKITLKLVLSYRFVTRSQTGLKYHVKNCNKIYKKGVYPFDSHEKTVYNKRINQLKFSEILYKCVTFPKGENYENCVKSKGK